MIKILLNWFNIFLYYLLCTYMINISFDNICLFFIKMKRTAELFRKKKIRNGCGSLRRKSEIVALAWYVGLHSTGKRNQKYHAWSCFSNITFCDQQKDFCVSIQNVSNDLITIVSWCSYFNGIVNFFVGSKPRGMILLWNVRFSNGWVYCFQSCRHRNNFHSLY